MSDEQQPTPCTSPPASEVAWESQVGRPLHPMLDFDEARRAAVVCLPLALRNGEVGAGGGRPVHAKPYLVVVGDGFRNCVPLELAAIPLETEPVFIQQRSPWPKAHLQAFLNGGHAASGCEVFDTIYDIVTRYVDLSDPAEAKVVALFIMMSYMHPVFTTVPYIKLEGPRASGKTRLATVIAHLAHNALHTSSLTPASIFRVSQGTRCTLIADEMEGLGKNKQLSMLLNAGYKRGAVVVRAGAKGKLEMFASFGPKLIASIEPLNEVLASRTLLIRLVPTTNAAKARLPVTETSEDWGEIRGMLYSWALTRWQSVMATLIPEAAGVSNRSAEIWTPLLQVAASLGGEHAAAVQEVMSYASRASRPALPTMVLSEAERLVVRALASLDHARRPQELSPAAILAAMAAYSPGSPIPSASSLGAIMRRLELFRSRRHSAAGQIYSVAWDRVLALNSAT